LNVDGGTKWSPTLRKRGAKPRLKREKGRPTPHLEGQNQTQQGRRKEGQNPTRKEEGRAKPNTERQTRPKWWRRRA